MHQNRPASARTSRGHQFGAGTAIGKAGIHQIAAKMRDRVPGTSEHSVESQLLDLANSIHPVAEDFTVIKVGRVHCVAGTPQPFRPLQHPWPETIGGMKQHNFLLQSGPCVWGYLFCHSISSGESNAAEYTRKQR